MDSCLASLLKYKVEKSIYRNSIHNSVPNISTFTMLFRRSLTPVLKSLSPSLRPLTTLTPTPVPTIADIKSEVGAIGGGRVHFGMVGDGIAEIVLDDPDFRNAMTGKMMSELNDAVDQMERFAGTKGAKAFLLRARRKQGVDASKERSVGD